MIESFLLNDVAGHAAAVDRAETFPAKAFEALAAAGLLAIVLPGHPLDFDSQNTSGLLHLLKQLGSADLSVGRIFEGHVNALYLIHLYGTEVQKNRYYMDVLADKKLFGVWNTQAEHGIQLHAHGDGSIELQGSKTFCSGAGWVSRPLITGDFDNGSIKGWQLCVVPTEAITPIVQDASFWNPMGMKGSVSYRMDFSGIRVSGDDLLGDPGDYYRQPVFSGGAIRFAAVQLGGAEAILESVVSYLQELRRTDDAFQRARVAEITWLVTSGQHWIEQAGEHADQWMNDPAETARMLAFANMTRTAIAEICTRTMQLAVECIGARGMMYPNRIERILRDLTFYLRQPAPDASLTAIGEYMLNNNSTAHELWR